MLLAVRTRAEKIFADDFGSPGLRRHVIALGTKKAALPRLVKLLELGKD